MASIRLSLRAAVLFTLLAVGEVSARLHDNSAAPGKLRKRGRCRHSISSLPASSSTPGEDINSSSTETSSVESLPTLSSSFSSSSSEPLPTFTSSLTILTSVALSASTPQPSSASPSSSSSWSLPSSTSMNPSSSQVPLSTATVTSSSVLTTSTTSVCEPTITTWSPELCWRSVPARCNSITASSVSSVVLSAHVSACSTSLVNYNSQLPPEVAGCFQSMGKPEFAPTSAWSCIASAPIYCSSTTVCPPSSTSTSSPIIPAFDGSFEKAASGDWSQLTAPANPGSFGISFSTEEARTGSYSLKIQSNNANVDTTTWGHRVKFEPGRSYEFAFWYYSTTNAQTGTLGLKGSWPGAGTTLVMNPRSLTVNTWKQQRFALTPSTSFGTVSIVYTSTQGTGPNVIYIDDVTVTRI
ncbi:hypothetical protein V8F20_005611 [Naviculisporaceae sp. PSN 640]